MATRTVNDLYNFYQYIVRKQRGVFVTPAQFNANMDAGQMDAVADWFAPFGETQNLHDALRKLRVYYQFTSGSDGMVSFPSDYIHILGSPFTVTGSSVNEVVFVQDTELPFALKSQLRPVSTSYPIAIDTSTGFSLYPQTTQIGFFFYLKRPATITFAFTQVGRVITYDSANSVQPEFSDIYFNNILARALVYAGINMSEAEITAFAEKYNEETK
jgi:hypothetical protein